MAAKQELLDRVALYTQRNRLTLGEQLGLGIHGIVFVAESQTKPGASAIKVHERESSYCRERDVYLRLQDRGVTAIRGCHVPQLLRFDDDLWVIEMDVVKRPFVLDFAGAYLDRAPDYPEDILAEWEAEKREQFGDRWGEIQRILWALERHGIFVLDISPSNICLDKAS